ncbi:Ger(x)C family spore germination protein [Paenibacillus filicis]|uniref:Ger(X)C family spore germination protein n=1 Tax=Paenibacillus filicis TaxID=669464 RepID=A0ABU9DF92_9BACL
MLKGKLVKTAIVALCLLTLTGCWSRRELNDLLIVLGIGFDWQDGQYLVSFQVVNPSEISAQKKSGDRPPTTLYQGRGRTMQEAARSLTAEAPRKVYMGHLQLYVVSEELAKRGLHQFIDNALRDNEHRMDFNVVIARGTRSENILKIYTPLEKLPTYSMLHSLETSEKNWAPTVSITMDDVLNKLSSEGNNLALTGIRLLGSVEEAEQKTNVETFLARSRYRYNGIAAFKKDKLIGWLNEAESKGYTDIWNKLQSTTIAIPCSPSSYTAIEITSSHSKLDTKVVGDTAEVTINIRSEGSVNERTCSHIDLLRPSTIKELEAQTAEIVHGNAEAAVKRAKSMKSDILGFGNKLSKDHPDYWEKVKENWDEKHFPQTKVNYKIQTFIRQTGTTGNSTVKF